MKEIRMMLSDSEYEKLIELKKEKNLSWSQLLIYLFEFNQTIDTVQNNTILQENIFKYIDPTLKNLTTKVDKINFQFEDLIRGVYEEE